MTWNNRYLSLNVLLFHSLFQLCYLLLLIQQFFPKLPGVSDHHLLPLFPAPPPHQNVMSVGLSTTLISANFLKYYILLWNSLRARLNLTTWEEWRREWMGRRDFTACWGTLLDVSGVEKLLASAVFLQQGFLERAKSAAILHISENYLGRTSKHAVCSRIPRATGQLRTSLLLCLQANRALSRADAVR